MFNNKKVKMTSSLNILIIEYNKIGIIPGPEESETDFIRRAKSCLGMRARITSELGSALPLRPEELAPCEVLAKPLDGAERLWGVRPDWVPVFFSNYRLLPWHGGCAWIIQLKAEDPPLALFQLRRAFAHKEIYLGFYPRDELIEHELCHVGRMCFEEPQFEEILAYQASSSWFRRWFGPLFQSSSESVIFLTTLLLILAVDVYVLLSWGHEIYAQVSSLKLLPGAMMAFGLVRLLLRKWQFQRCRKNLASFFNGDEARANQVMYRLTDREIVAFGQKEKISKHLHDETERSLRWQLLRKVYFGSGNSR